MNVRVRVRSTAPWLSGAGIEAAIVAPSVEAALERLERDDEVWAAKYRRVVRWEETDDPLTPWGGLHLNIRQVSHSGREPDPNPPPRRP